ncbi:hypothetical protein D7B12_18050 [Salmonella enterica]|nr:hypothetical protein [Salmonella enterica]
MIHHFYLMARMYCVGMVGMGVLIALIDQVLFRFGLITRRVTMRGCFVIGLFWPLFIFLLGVMLWRLRKQL